MTSKKKISKSNFAIPRLVISLISLAGIGVMAYLTYIHFAHATSFCDLSETVSCDVVTTSIYSEIFGLPVSILGLGYFGLTLLLILFNKSKGVFQAIFFLTLFILIPSYYLTAIEAFVLEAFCILCETSKILMLVILVASFFAMKQKFREVAKLSIPIILAGFVAVGVTFFAQTGETAKKDYTPFVNSLNEKGLVYYKSFRCSNCKRQEKTIGEAYTKLNQVECHPDGEGGNPELCLEKGIDHTPTFLIEDNGDEVKRHEGRLSLEKLAEFADVPVSKLDE